MDRLRCPYCGKENEITDILQEENLPVTLEWECECCENEYRATIDFMIFCKSEKIIKYKNKELSPSQRIEEFVKYCGYTYKIEDILESYVKYWIKNIYVSHTMKHCIENMEEEIKKLIGV